MKNLVISTRGSKLALWQSNHIKDILEANNSGLSVELRVVITKGDKILDTPLALIGGKGLFTKEVEDLMLDGRAHLAVHSLKDMPTEVHPDLQLTAITMRQDVRDAMLSQKYKNIEDLPKGAIVGTTSLRRRMQLSKLRPDLIMKELRGNVDTRINKLKNGEYDAIILAAAGINRLGLNSNVNYFSEIEIDDMVPSMGQGALAIETTKDPEVIKIVDALNDTTSCMETTIERDFVGKLEGSCSVPIGVSARMQNNGTMVVKAILGMPDGTEVLEEFITIKKENYKIAGVALAQSMINKGAIDLLKRAEEKAFK
jgi:hydroxymethylbilane synthase